MYIYIYIYIYINLYQKIFANSLLVDRGLGNNPPPKNSLNIKNEKNREINPNASSSHFKFEF